MGELGAAAAGSFMKNEVAKSSSFMYSLRIERPFNVEKKLITETGWNESKVCDVMLT